MESLPANNPGSPLADEHFPDAKQLEDIIDELALRESIKILLEKEERDWEEADHYQVRLESIERLRENILSHIHPYLAYFAEKAGWIQPRDLTYLINVHSPAEESGYLGHVTDCCAVKGVSRIHPLILDGWEREMS